MLEKEVAVKVRITHNHKTKVVTIHDTIPHYCETKNDVLWHLKNNLQFVIDCINSRLMIDGFSYVRKDTQIHAKSYFD